MPPAGSRVARVLLPLLATAVLVVALSGCSVVGASSTERSVGEQPAVVVTTAVLGSLVAEVVGDAPVSVTVLMPPGADPHSFAPSARDAQRVAGADLVIANGLGLEESLAAVLDAAASDGIEILRLAELVDPQPFTAGHDHDHEGAHGTEHDADLDGEPLDPHVWLDPIRVAAMAEDVAAAVAGLAPADADTLTTRGAAVAASYTALAGELAETLDAIPDRRRSIVTNHDAFGYLAARFDLEVVATVLPGSSTQASASAADVTGLYELLEDEGVPAVFTEATGPDRVARALAADLGDVAVVELYSGSPGPPGSGAETVAGMLRTDAQRLVDALG